MRTTSSRFHATQLPVHPCCGGLGYGGDRAAAEPVAAAPEPQGHVLFHSPHALGRGRVQDARGISRHGTAQHPARPLRCSRPDPDYRFVLDQACYVKPFLERYPEEEAALRKFVEEGRLAIVGGTDVMLDVNMPGGESFVRQVLYGKGYFRQKLGVDVKVGWQLDTFGHHAQMPQLMKLGGYQSFWFFRGVADWNVPAEFLWEGIDGSRIPAFWLPHGYAHTYGSPQDLPAFAEVLPTAFRCARAVCTRCRPSRVGGSRRVRTGSARARTGRAVQRPARRSVQLRMAVPTDYEAFVAQRPDRPVVTGELNPIFQGAYSSRIELKQRTRELERLLTTAEKLDVMLRRLAVPVDDQVLWRAWEPMLFNQAHDLMSGVMTDRVHEDTIRSYDFSRRIAG